MVDCWLLNWRMHGRIAIADVGQEYERQLNEFELVVEF